MSAGGKIIDNQNNSLTIDLSENDLDTWRLNQVIYWPHFVSRQREYALSQLKCNCVKGKVFPELN
jgi:hypothetical protein